ncbi:hypothetical protein [Paraburkholderia humisilvae]
MRPAPISSAGERSVFDIPGRLASMLFGLSLILPALSIARLIRGAAPLLRVSRGLARVLSNVTRGAALLSLLGRMRSFNPDSEKDRRKSNVQSVTCEHDVTSRTMLDRYLFRSVQHRGVTWTLAHRPDMRYGNAQQGRKRMRAMNASPLFITRG